MNKTTISRQTVRVSGLLVLAAAVASASIFPPRQGDLTAEIPFEFVAGQKTMAAGSYIIRTGSEGRVELCEDGVYCETVSFQKLEGAGGTGTHLSFQREQDRYFLHQVETPDAGVLGLSNPAPAAKEAGEGIEIDARPLCIHRHSGMNLSMSWH